jgi:hypothetical protein
MKTQTGWILGLALVGACGASASHAQQAGAPPPSLSDDRLILSANGSTLENSDDGYGGFLRWLHNFTPGAQIGIGAEYQKIADSDWTIGTLTATLTHEGSSGVKTSGYVEGNVGSGKVLDRDFDYAISAVGLIQAWPGGFSVQLEDRQIDVDRTHGNLPKLALGYQWSPRFLTTVSYADSVSGNLGTQIYSARFDIYGGPINVLGGAAFGEASPAVVNLQTGLVQPALNLKEGFLGLARPFRGGEVTLVGDYLNLEDTERMTLTLSCNIHLRRSGR